MEQISIPNYNMLIFVIDSISQIKLHNLLSQRQ